MWLEECFELMDKAHGNSQGRNGHGKNCMMSEIFIRIMMKITKT